MARLPVITLRALYKPSHVRVIALAIFVILVWLRIPEIMHRGRFWAEEGSVYFLHAWTMPWRQALFLPVNGYISLVANAAGLMAYYLVSLRNAPHVTMAIALLVQCLPAVLIVSAPDAWLRRPSIIIVSMLLMAMPPVCEEVWLNTANSQFHLELTAALCLVLEVPTGISNILRMALLLVIPLCSPGSIALAPLFTLRAILDRKRPRIAFAACFVAGSALQMLLFYTPLSSRGNLFSLTVLASILAVKNLAIPFLGEQEANLIAADVHNDVVTGHCPVATVLVVAGVAALVSGAILLRRRPEPLWLLLAGGAIAIISYYGALDSGPNLITVVGANRYAFAPSILFNLTAVSLAATATRTDRVSQGAWCAVIWLLTIAVQQTLLPHDVGFVKGPSWKAQIALWRADPSHPIGIWPTGWSIAAPHS